MDTASMLPGSLVKVTKGAFIGRIGVVLDQNHALDERGNPLSGTRPGSGYSWVMLTLNDKQFPAHLYHDEFEMIGSAPQDHKP